MTNIERDCSGMLFFKTKIVDKPFLPIRNNKMFINLTGHITSDIYTVSNLNPKKQQQQTNTHTFF